MTVADDTETRRRPEPPVDDEFGSKLRREQVHVALFGDRPEPARIDRFALIEPIGSGGMGELYAAYDAQLDRKIALKLVRTGRGNSKADARLLREAQALAKLSHPNVVAVYEVGFADQRVFVAMEYVRGQTLTAWLASASTLRERERVRELLVRFRDAGRGLAAVHEAGLAHRDFKPDNVVVGDDGRVRVVDFGLARSTSEVDEPAGESQAGGSAIAMFVDESGERGRLTPEVEIGTLTNTGTLLGTPRYMAPEQWRALRGDSRSDQFSFCVALYNALHGSWPFESVNLAGLSAAVLEGKLREAPRKPEVSARLQAALRRGLATDADERWPDMSELLAAIDEALSPRRRRLGGWMAALASTIVMASSAVLLAEREPLPLTTKIGALATTERELGAEGRRIQIGKQIAELDARGEFDEGDRVFEAYATLPQYARTRALARAWLDQAQRLRGRADTKGELAALGEAQLASSSADQQREALIELARVQTREHQYSSLGATLSVLDDLAFDGELAGEVLAMRVHEAAARRDLAGALAALEQPEAEPHTRELAPLLRQLDRTTPSEWRVTPNFLRHSSIVEVPGLDVDGDGRRELLLAQAGDPIRVLSARPDLALVQEFDLDIQGRPVDGFVPSSPSSLRSGAPSWVVGSSRDSQEIFEVRVEAGQVAARSLLDSTAIDWTSGDLFDGEGWAGWEAYGASRLTRRLTGLRPLGEGLQAFEPQPALASLDSIVDAVEIADLDGDGSEELIVGVSGWWAFDVRVLTPTREPGRFDLAARRKLGGISGQVSFPAPSGVGRWLAVSVGAHPPAPRVFPASAPSGVSPGVYMLAWAGPGHGLELVESIALPDAHRPSAGDLDGDGRSELVVQLNSAIVVLRPGADVRDSTVWLEGLRYHAILDLDDDGDDELIVSDQSDRVWVLGAGEESMPTLARPAHQRVEPPSELELDLRELWTRAETLAMVGLSESAVSTFAELARLSSEGGAAHAHRRAAELSERIGARRRAAEFYTRAGDPDSLVRALELDRAVHRFDEAARVADRLVALAEPDQIAAPTELAAALHRRAEPKDRLEFDFSEPLDEGWRIARPGLLRSESDGLRIDLLGSRDPILATHAFVWDGDRLELELELGLERMEWGAQLRVELVAVDEAGRPGPTLDALSIGSWGGGGHYVLDFEAGTAFEPDSFGGARKLQGASPPSGQTRFRMRLDLTDDDARAWSTVSSLGEGPLDTMLEYDRGFEPETLRPGRYELRISAGLEPWVRGVVRLERLRLLGAREDPDARAPTRREQVLLGLAKGEHERVLELLDDPAGDALEPDEAAWLRGLALEQLGRWPLAIPQIERALGHCEGPEVLSRFGYAMLLQPDRFGPIVRERCRPDHLVIDTWTVAWTTLFHHPDLADVHRTMTTQLVDLDRQQPRSFEEARAIADLLTARSRGWYMQSLESAAESDLRRAIELSGQWLERPTLTEDQRRELSRLRGLAHVRLAGILMARNQPDDAADELLLALTRDRSPEIIADVIIARSMFAPLIGTPIWAKVLAAQAGLELE
ncbi:protein kinase domain-containing protein [Nannocystaceae bacterium ST9]